MDGDRLDEAEQVFTEILDLQQRRPEATRQSAQQRNTLAGARCNLGTLLVERGRLNEAVGHLEAAVETQTSLAREFPQLIRYREDEYLFRWNLIDLRIRQGLHDEAAAAAMDLAEQNRGQLRAQYEAADLLLRCVKGVKGGENSHLADAAQQWQSTASQLVAEARITPETSVDAVGYFAWFLAMCRDESLRNPRTASPTSRCKNRDATGDRAPG